MTRYNREDSRTVLPQLEKQTDKLTTNVDELISSTEALDASIEELDTKTDNVFIIDTYNPSNYDFTANQYRSLSRSVTEHSGYTPIIVRAMCNSHSALHVFNYYVSGSNVVYEVINRSSSSVTGANFVIQILWLKTALSG